MIFLCSQYEVARSMYQQIGVDTEAVLGRLQDIPVSVHCWQIDDLSGFESPDRGLSGGIAGPGQCHWQTQDPTRIF